MAIEKVINIRVDNAKAIDSINNLAKSIKKADEEATNLDATFEEVYGDLKPLTARMGEAEDRLYELAAAGKTTSKEYKDLLAAVANYRKIQIQTDAVVDAASTTMSNKLGGALNAAAGGFSLVQGTMALVGTESKEVEEAILKVQAAMAISQGVETINQGAKSVQALGTAVKSYAIVQKVITAGQWLWNTAMAANPLGAIVAAIAAVIAAGVALFRYFQSSSKLAKENTEAVKANAKALDLQTKSLEKNKVAFENKQKFELDMAKASGKSAEAIRQLELKLIDERVAYQKSAREIAKNTLEKNKNKLATLQAAGAEDDVIKAQIENTNKAVQEYNKQNENVQSAFDERQSIIKKHQVEAVAEETNAIKVIEDKRKAAYEKRKAQLEEERKKREEAAKKEIEDEKKRIEAINKIQDDYFKKIEDLEDVTQLQKIARQEERDLAELEALNATELEKYELKEYYAKLTEEELEKVAKAASEKKAAKNKEDADKAIEIEKYLADAKKQIQDATISNISAGIGLLKELSGKNKALQKTAIIAESALGIGKSIIQTSSSNIATAAQGAALAIPTSGQSVAAASALITANNIGLGVGIAANVAATAKALSSLGGGSAPSAGAKTAGGGASAPSFNLVQGTGSNQIAESLTTERRPIQAYVVASNVTSAQELDRNSVSEATV